MKVFILIMIGLYVVMGMSARNITDMGGRNVEIPDHLDRILPYDVKTSVLLFPVANTVMAAKALLSSSQNLTFISDEYNTMSEVDMKNIESVLAIHPQVIIAGVHHFEHNYSKYDKLQKRTHIPVVLVDLSVDKLDETYTFLGKLLAEDSACSVCVDFLKEIYSQTDKLITGNSHLQANVYYALGGTGLMTDPAGSKHTEVMDYMQLNNVAEVAMPTGGHAKVNMEQVLIWNPDYIFTAGFKAQKSAIDMIVGNSKWASISAVEKGQVFKVPSQPFGWFGLPPSVNRICGVVLLSQVFYQLPEAVAKAQILEFYKLFYHYELTSSEYHSLLE